MKAIRRRNLVKDILWVFVTLGLVAVIARFTRGLGPSTALTDATPWGFWIGFDVTAGVALAAGGFTVAGIVYIFHLEKYRPIVRPAVLTAFLGYVAVIIGLLVDLGLPWHIWRPIINWQPHSVLFEVAWCVMLYTTVLALEFAPTAFEHPFFQQPLFQRISHILKTLLIPLVIAGIVLSTLHQSSLGSLFLIMPFRLHPLWYSPWLPVLFFISAIGLGLMMVTLEGFFSSYLYEKHPFHRELYAGLGRMAAWVLWLYLALRLGDLAWRGDLGLAFSGSWQSFLFLFEIGIAALIPAILLSIPKVRTSQAGLGTAAALTVSGIILNRLSSSFIAMGTGYVPNWMELAMSAGIVAGAMLVFIFLTESLNVLDPVGGLEPRPSPYDKPVFDPNTGLYQGFSWWDTLARRSLSVVIISAVAIAFLPAQVVTGKTQPRTPVKPALGWEEMTIDGDRDEVSVIFDHAGHQERRLELHGGDEEQACLDCHHLSLPEDEATACAECHGDMFLTTDIFDHTYHQQEMGGNEGCSECHTGGTHTRHNTVPCGECHDTMAHNRDGSTPFDAVAASYEDAMHNNCIVCHETERPEKPELARCPACHNFTEGVELTEAR